MESDMNNPTTNTQCGCRNDTPPPPGPLESDCYCPRNELGLLVHEENCLLYKNETFMYPHTPEECECKDEPTEVCECCSCLPEQCRCKKAGREAFDEWRRNRDAGEMPTVLETTHPLMQKFQESLRLFLEKENEHAEKEIIELRSELADRKLQYDRDLEGIYTKDHQTNGQRVLIEEYESTLAAERKRCEEANERTRILNEKYKECQEQLDADMMMQRDSMTEVDALTALVHQLEKWREETESELTVSQRVTDKMRQEKRAIAHNKRKLDMYIFGVTNEIWKLEGNVELYRKQMEIKNIEMDKVVDKVVAYAAELEELDLDKKRLMSLWNSVLVNIKQRDSAFDSVRDDYRNLQENYRTLVKNLEITKKMNEEEMQKSRVLIMDKEKIELDTAGVQKLFDTEDQKKSKMEVELAEIGEAIDLICKDQEMIDMENHTMTSILATTEREFDRRMMQKVKIENEILDNLQECLLNDKAVSAMAQGIKNMRNMARRLEISLSIMENKHAKTMLQIEIYKSKQDQVAKTLEKTLQKVNDRERDLDALEEEYTKTSKLISTKQREYDIVQKKYNTLKEMTDMKSPQELRIVDLEKQIKGLRERTETMQYDWMRLQGLVVKLTSQQQKTVTDIALLDKQIQILDQKLFLSNSQLSRLRQERQTVDRTLRYLRGRMVLLEQTKRKTTERGEQVAKDNQTISYEYAANLKDAESGLIDIQEEIEILEREKSDLTKELDKVTREALIWQRKGIMAVELKRNIKQTKQASGEIGQMKIEIHRMEARREALRRTADKLSTDLSLFVMRREIVLDKTRAAAAAEQSRGGVGRIGQSTYKHKLRLIKSDVARVTKELAGVNAEIKQLEQDRARFMKEIADLELRNSRLEEAIASLLRECRTTDREKQWLLERVVRSQRMGSELQRAVKRQNLRVRKPKNAVIAEYENARLLNERLRYIVVQLNHDFPYMQDNLETIANTLNIYSPGTSPRLTDEGRCPEFTEVGDFGCIIPEEQEEPIPPTPVCRTIKDTCVDCTCTETDATKCKCGCEIGCDCHASK